MAVVKKIEADGFEVLEHVNEENAIIDGRGWGNEAERNYGFEVLKHINEENAIIDGSGWEKWSRTQLWIRGVETW